MESAVFVELGQNPVINIANQIEEHAKDFEQKSQNGHHADAEDVVYYAPYEGDFVEELNPKLKPQRLTGLYLIVIIRSKPFFLIVVGLHFFLTFKVLAPSLPEELRLLALDQLIQGVLDVGLSEVGKSARNHNEQNDTHGKHVY